LRPAKAWQSFPQDQFGVNKGNGHEHDLATRFLPIQIPELLQAPQRARFFEPKDIATEGNSHYFSRPVAMVAIGYASSKAVEKARVFRLRG
jgi:hypothetical protein